MTDKQIPENIHAVMSTEERARAIDELHRCLSRLWSGGYGDGGIYTVATEVDKLRVLLHRLLSSPTSPPATDTDLLATLERIDDYLTSVLEHEWRPEDAMNLLTAVRDMAHKAIAKAGGAS